MLRKKGQSQRKGDAKGGNKFKTESIKLIVGQRIAFKWSERLRRRTYWLN